MSGRGRGPEVTPADPAAEPGAAPGAAGAEAGGTGVVPRPARPAAATGAATGAAGRPAVRAAGEGRPGAPAPTGPRGAVPGAARPILPSAARPAGLAKAAAVVPDGGPGAPVRTAPRLATVPAPPAAPAVAGVAEAETVVEAGDATGQRTAARALPRVGQTKSIVGSFDAIDHGYEVAGWVFDIARPTRRCRVQLRIDGEMVAEVEAGLPRPDLEVFRIRANCGFRITVPAPAFDGVIHTVEVWLPEEQARLGVTRPLACVISDHKTYPKEFSVNSILRLEDGAIDHDRIFSGAFLQRHGVRAAVAYAYLWILKRPPDRGGWDAYSDRILAGEISLGTCVRELAGSEEAAKARRAGVDLRAEFEAVVAAAARLQGGAGPQH